jgi:2,3-bisphosphoglycerate-independent phosphoglycerate mutase
MPGFKRLFGLQGAVISAVDLIKGIGIYAGMKVVEVKGATGLYNTNYEGKAEAAIEALVKNDLVYLHVEASDEAGHEGDYHLKIRTIEFLDNRIVRYIIDHLPQVDDDVTIAILPDHPTPCELRSHVRDSVPFTIFNPHLPADHVQRFDEITSKKGFYREIKGTEFLNLLLSS